MACYWYPCFPFFFSVIFFAANLSGGPSFLLVQNVIITWICCCHLLKPELLNFILFFIPVLYCCSPLILLESIGQFPSSSNFTLSGISVFIIKLIVFKMVSATLRATFVWSLGMSVWWCGTNEVFNNFKDDYLYSVRSKFFSHKLFYLFILHTFCLFTSLVLVIL